ncbi:nucleosome assembly protein (nap) protein [Cardiosporidium cionae]|uniref:Nucleosome assembly protein (Nap) protein n=1 Tax=Cardiosporidium cionae TaxID=476202 RepID=A0ABQ7J8Y3_9APIC|nr:nucleosome assembly protein (nap) protein [Cardiosporidium cionae]|eukprot:KAF8820461.1 nucleosome assembly protein (nap) protein [Cardiosporidium cionae]
MAKPDSQNPNEVIKNISAAMKEVRIDDENDIFNALPEDEKAVITELKSVQVKHKAIEAKYDQEWAALKLRYELMFLPLYEKRAELLVMKSDSINEKSPATSVAGFWLKTFLNHQLLKEKIEQYDKCILEYLTDVRSEWIDSSKQESFRLIFMFAPNPYFTNTVLTKQYNVETEEGEEDAMLQSTVSTVIEWNEGKDVTKKTITRKTTNKRTHELKYVREVQGNAQSFFTFFNSREIPSAQSLQQMEHVDVVRFGEEVELDFNIGVIIRERIIPYAVKWFLGEMDSEESDGEFLEDESERDMIGDTDDEDF